MRLGDRVLQFNPYHDRQGRFAPRAGVGASPSFAKETSSGRSPTVSEVVAGTAVTHVNGKTGVFTGKYGNYNGKRLPEVKWSDGKKDVYDLSRLRVTEAPKPAPKPAPQPPKPEPAKPGYDPSGTEVLKTQPFQYVPMRILRPLWADYTRDVKDNAKTEVTTEGVKWTRTSSGNSNYAANLQVGSKTFHVQVGYTDNRPGTEWIFNITQIHPKTRETMLMWGNSRHAYPTMTEAAREAKLEILDRFGDFK